MSEIEIRQVNAPRQWKDFYRVKCDIYRNDAAAVIPLRKMEFSLLDDQKHPFYEHAQRAAFVAYRNDKPIARIAAIKDDMHNDHYQDRVGFFGFFECPDDVQLANRLLETAKDWLLERGLDAMRGPVNPSMKSEFGVLVEGHEFPPYIMMAHTPNYYANLLESSGLEVVRGFHAFLLESADAHAEGHVRYKRLIKFMERVKKRHPTLEVVSGNKASIEDAIREVNILGNEVRSEGWGFVPMTTAELDFMVSQVKRVIDPKMTIRIFVKGELAGYHISIPNVNWAIKRTRGPDWLRMLQLAFWLPRIPEGRCIALGAAKKYRRAGVGIAAVKAMVDLMDQYKFWEFSWVDEHNKASEDSIASGVPSKKYKRYHLYQKSIS